MRLVLVVLTSALLAACGFSLRGYHQAQSAEQLPLYLDFSGSELSYRLRQDFIASFTGRGFDLEAGAEHSWRLRISSWREERTALSLDADGAASRYTLRVSALAVIESSSPETQPVRELLLAEENYAPSSNSSADQASERAIYQRLSQRVIAAAADFSLGATANKSP